jgi:ethanolamine ammonia-lyase small subunit
MSDIEKRDPWFALARHTAARIALGRAGGSVRTDTLLDFRLAHARAKDAVELPFDANALERELGQAGHETFRLETGAVDRGSFLLRPDLGRRLSAASRAALEARAVLWGTRDLCIVVSDGLSALAAERQVPPLLARLAPLLAARSVSSYPILVAPFARVKLADEVGQTLGARHSLILLGERPGLSSPDSLGAYLTFNPREACSDADRNCVSNIRPEGLAHDAAAQVLADLLTESAKRGLSGVALKLKA